MTVEILGYDEYLTAEGETYDGLALTFYNEEKLASYIIQANPDYMDVLIFEQGIKINIPILNVVETPDTLPPWRRSA